MNTFTLKCIALVLMVIDHIGLYFENTPSWFRLIGRCSYPIFLFCMVWGYHYTKSRRNYLLRLYLMSIFMACFRYFIVHRFPVSDNNIYASHNIFASLFLVGIIISTIEAFKENRKKGILMLCLIFGMQALFYVVLLCVPFVRYYINGDYVTAFIPNLVLNEYGFEAVVLGVLMYFLKEKKELLGASYVLFCIYQFSSEMLVAWSAVQSFMIFALPLMLCYNNKKGPGMKYFFYIFYPAHTFLLFYLANFVFTG